MLYKPIDQAKQRVASEKNRTCARYTRWDIPEEVKGGGGRATKTSRIPKEEERIE